MAVARLFRNINKCDSSASNFVFNCQSQDNPKNIDHNINVNLGQYCISEVPGTWVSIMLPKQHSKWKIHAFFKCFCQKLKLNKI